MWLLIAREPRPDVPIWAGRRFLAAMDAILWPSLWAVAFLHAPHPAGAVGPVVAALALVAALARLRRAIWMNERYRFTTWRWGRLVAALLLIGLVLKLTLPG